MKILAIDLGQFNSVACLFDTATHQSQFETIATQRWALEPLLNQTQPEQIVIETSAITGWGHDFCQSLGYSSRINFSSLTTKLSGDKYD